MLTFYHTEDIKKVFEIEWTCHTKVVNNTLISQWRHDTLIPQCKRCQRYGHTYNFSQRQPACVKCAGRDLTADCRIPKKKNADAKCFN